MTNAAATYSTCAILAAVAAAPVAPLVRVLLVRPHTVHVGDCDTPAGNDTKLLPSR